MIDKGISKAMLSFRDVSAGYGNLRVLKNISFTVEERKIVSMVGANGAGKTTLLKTISGLIHPRTGTITFFDSPIHFAAPHEIVALGIVHVPEGRQVFTSLTIEDNLKMGAYLPTAKAKREETLKEIYGMFPILKERRKQLAGTLSGGEQQMLAIGRGLMSKPKFLMLDEPSLGLAPLIVSNIFSIVRLINDQGLTVLLVEQNVSQALKMSHWAYVIENGRIAIAGTGKELAMNDHTKKAYFGGR
jgi:branched-chain amino acid transport system ATP-binding protein